MITQVLKNIKMFRESLGLSQYDVAKKMNISQSAYARFESGKSKLDLDTINEFSRALNLKIEDILFYPKKYINLEEIESHVEERVSITIEVRKDKKEKILNVLLGDKYNEILK